MQARIYFGKKMEKNAEKSRESEADVAEESVFQALAEFNKWHGAEAVAEIIKLEGPSITVELSGPFCKTCGFYDYFDDLKIEIEKVLGKSLEIAQVRGGGERFVVMYRIKKGCGEK
jgi:predicted Zn-ribbon and HTH transcriptional regulator